MGGLVVVGAAVWVVEHYHLFDGTTSTPLTVEQARDRYRDLTSSTIATATTAPSTTAPSTTAPTSVAPSSSTSTTAIAVDAELPAPGVYTYATTGADSVDALTGAHHDYPATTTITVTPSGCGVVARWDVLEERWDEWGRCVHGNTIRQPTHVTFDVFFGQSQTDTYQCTGDGRPVDAPPGTTWTTSCVQGTDADTRTGVVVGTEPMTVGDVEVSTLHVRVAITNDQPGDSEITDTWYRVGTDLVIAQTGDSATTNPSPVGDVHYRELYEIHLTSLTPLT